MINNQQTRTVHLPEFDANSNVPNVPNAQTRGSLNGKNKALTARELANASV